jgi:hypothetical protein
VTAVLSDRHEQLGPLYSDIGRPSIDPELLIRIHLVGYCFGIRSERELREEVCRADKIGSSLRTSSLPWMVPLSRWCGLRDSR